MLLMQLVRQIVFDHLTRASFIQLHHFGFNQFYHLVHLYVYVFPSSKMPWLCAFRPFDRATIILINYRCVLEKFNSLTTFLIHTTVVHPSPNTPYFASLELNEIIFHKTVTSYTQARPYEILRLVRLLLFFRTWIPGVSPHARATGALHLVSNLRNAPMSQRSIKRRILLQPYGDHTGILHVGGVSLRKNKDPGEL